MRIITQNAIDAKLIIDNELKGEIKKGLLLLVSFTSGDNKEIVDKMVNKLLSLRIFPDENGKTDLSLNDINGELMSISQFTLYANVKEGRRPSFTECMRPDEAKELYLYFNTKLHESNLHIVEGVFGADMKLDFTNDGPFTLILDSREIIK